MTRSLQYCSFSGCSGWSPVPQWEGSSISCWSLPLSWCCSTSSQGAAACDEWDEENGLNRYDLNRFLGAACWRSGAHCHWNWRHELIQLGCFQVLYWIPDRQGHLDAHWRHHRGHRRPRRHVAQFETRLSVGRRTAKTCLSDPQGCLMSVAKRFKNKVLCRGAGRRHLLQGKSSKRRRSLRKAKLVEPTDVYRVNQNSPFSHGLTWLVRSATTTWHNRRAGGANLDSGHRRWKEGHAPAGRTRYTPQGRSRQKAKIDEGGFSLLSGGFQLPTCRRIVSDARGSTCWPSAREALNACWHSAS